MGSGGLGTYPSGLASYASKVIFKAMKPQRSLYNLVENLLGDFEFEIQTPYLLYRNAAQEVNGIWFYNSREYEEVANLFKRILGAYSKVHPNPKSSIKSDFEELEAVPTTAVIEGLLEPSFYGPGSAAVPIDSPFMNLFSLTLLLLVIVCKRCDSSF